MRPFFLLFFLFATMVRSAMAQQTEAPTREQERSEKVRDAVQGGWYATDEDGILDAQKEVLDTLAPQIQLENVRSARNNALAKRKGKLAPTDCEELKQMATEVNAAAPSSFDGYMANYYAEFPSSNAFQQLEQAVAIDPSRSELVAPQLLNAARKDQPVELVRSANVMKQRGEVAPALYQMAEDILLSVDRNGVLIAAGEMDAYPVWVEQYADNDRTDVLTIDQRLLGDAAYRARMWERARAEGASPNSAESFLDQLYKATKRPVFLSLAVGQQLAARYSDKLYVTGLAMRMSDVPSGDPAQLESRWRTMHKPTDAGPLSGNYLVPGTVLLNHYRSIGNEEKAGALELELRTIAGRTGNTPRMYSNGVFQH